MIPRSIEEQEAEDSLKLVGYTLIVVVLVIFLLGLVMIFSTTSAEILDHDLNRNTHSALFKQLGYAIAGVFFAWGVVRIGYREILNWSFPLFCLFTFFLVLTLIPGIGKEVNGSRRWLFLGGVSFQPSEFMKYVLPCYFIYFCTKVQINSFCHFAKFVGLAAIPILLILVEPNNGTAAVLAIACAVLSFLLRIPFKYWVTPLLILSLIGLASAYHLPYVAGRINAYLHPELDIRGKGHQPYQAKIAAGSGALFGKGPGNSLQKLSYLPEAQNDYIAAIYAEEFGYVGISVLIFLYVIFLYQGCYIAIKSTDPSGFYLAGYISVLIGLQAFLNFGVVSGILPSTGLNLPFFSQGGSSLIANLMGLGLILSVGREGM